MKVLPLCIFIFTILSFSIFNIKLSSHNRLFLPPSTLKSLNLSGHFEFTKTDNVSKDFGNQHHYPPSAVLHPDSVLDIVNTVKHVYELGSYSDLTIAARGNGHATGGQSQAYHGIVVKMDSLSRHGMQVHSENDMSYIDVYGGELWIDVLRESLKYGLTPVSWTDYLYLSVGGTLSNAGISGQTFKYGPQISNVYQLEVVTGKGEVKFCSKQQNTDLFYAVLGGLGQFGIITRARIALAPAPTMVKWIRVVYADFLLFTKDQEHLISSESTFDYIEGFVIINKSGLLNNWWSSFTARDPLAASRFNTGGKTLFCLEIAKYYDPCKINIANEEVDGLLSELNFIASTLFLKEVSYLDFLDRVHTNEMALRSQGLWEVPHPWLNLLVPKTRIHEFGRGVFGNILTDSSIELILIYPVNKSKWDNGTSIVIPDDDIFYQVSFLSTAFPSTDGTNTLHYMLNLNKKILDFCESANVGMKQYLAYYTSQKEWRTHFGPQWGSFVKRKFSYDPLAILAPGQRIFQRKIHLL